MTFLKLTSNHVTPLLNPSVALYWIKSQTFSLKIKVLHHQLPSHLFILNSGLHLCKTFSPSHLPNVTEQNQTLTNLLIIGQFLTFHSSGIAFNLGLCPLGTHDENYLFLRSAHLLLYLYNNLGREGQQLTLISFYKQKDQTY